MTDHRRVLLGNSATALLLAVTLAFSGAPADAEPANRGGDDTRWHEVIEAVDAAGYACRVVKPDGRVLIRSRYAVEADGDYQVRFTTWARKDGRRQQLDRTPWLSPGSRGPLKGVTFSRKESRQYGAWRIKVAGKGVGWLAFDLTPRSIGRC